MRLREGKDQSGLIMEELYRMIDISRQGMSKRIRYWQNQQQIMDALIPMVRQYRLHKDRRAGSRSLFFNLEIKKLYGLGINKYERLMNVYQMTMKPLRVKVVTTKSSLKSWNYKNLLNGLELNDINKVVAGDITYVYLGRDLFYVFILMDLYSSRIVGINVSDRMRSIDAQEALLEWVKCRGKDKLVECVHHTDGGSQYFSIDYVQKLNELKVKISVARTCMENGYAEQFNSTIKHRLIPCKQIGSLNEFQKAIHEVAYFYNCERKQADLGWRTPDEFESYVQPINLDERVTIKFHDFENRIKGFSRHRSTKS